MGVQIIKQSGAAATFVTEYIADTDADVSKLPIDSCAPGSTCFVIDTLNIYMLNTQLVWKLLM